MKKRWYGLFILLVIGCGTKDKSESNKVSRDRNSDPNKPNQETPNQKYLDLVEKCDLTGGNAVVDDKCSQLKVSLTIDGKASISTVDSPKSIYTGGINQKSEFRFPFKSQKRTETQSYDYTLHAPPYKNLSENRMSVLTSVRTAEELSSFVSISESAGSMTRTRVTLNILGNEFKPEDQDPENFDKMCDLIHDSWKAQNGLVNGDTMFISNKIMGCGVRNQRETFGDLEFFKTFNISWHCDEEHCFFQSLILH